MYERINWKARRGTGLNKFTESERSGNTVVLVNTPDSITEPGTEFSPANLNHMDEGIERAHLDIAAEVRAREIQIAAEVWARERQIANEVRERELQFGELLNNFQDLIRLIESNLGPLSRIPLVTVTEEGYFLVTDEGDYLVA